MVRDLMLALRLAVRTLVKDRAFTIPALVALGLGMTLSAAALIVVNAYLVRTLPYPSAQRLYNVRYAAPGASQPRGLEALDWAALGDAIEHTIAWDLDMFYLLGGNHAEAAPGAWVTPGFMQGLGIQPAFGRGFDAGAFVSGSPQVALISHRLWQTRFSGDPQILGRRFEAYVSDRPDEAEAFTIVGVLPQDFWHVNPYTDVLVPLRAPTYPYLVRLREGVAPGDAAARMTALVRSSTSGLPPDWRVEIVPAHQQYVTTIRPVLRAVWGAAILVLLTAWANVAGLLLIRAARRRKEIAVRMALGAGGGAIARLLLLEGAVLGTAATAIGLVGGALLINGLAPLIQRQLGRSAPGGVSGFAADSTVIAGVALLGALTCLACGLAPLAASWRSGLRLHSSSRASTEERGTQRARALLITVEVAASLALLTGSMLMVQSVVRLVGVDLGIRGDRVLATSLTLRQRSYPDAEMRLAFYERAMDRLRAIPGVETVALTDYYPLQQARPTSVETDGGEGRLTARVSIVGVSADYFETLRIAIAGGRGFTPADRLGSEPVAMVSESLARRLWPTEHAIGGRVSVPNREEPDTAPVVRRVVGVVRDVRQTPDDADFADLYVPLLQTPGRFAFYYLRTAGSPLGTAPALRAAFTQIDPQMAIGTVRTLQDAIDEQSSRPKFLAWLLGAFAVVAGLLALVGVYGVIAYAVRQREREIAVRLALGAAPGRIMGLFLRQGSVVLGAGMALGVAAAIGTGRALESQLFGTRPADPLVLTTTAVAFATAGFVAVWWPARRAAATDPAAALKEE